MPPTEDTPNVLADELLLTVLSELREVRELIDTLVGLTALRD